MKMHELRLRFQVCPKGSNLQYSNIVSENGLAPTNGVSLLKHICVTQPQWVNTLYRIEAIVEWSIYFSVPLQHGTI